MKKFSATLLFLVLILGGCGQKTVDNKSIVPPTVEKNVTPTKTADITDVCNYFPKELIESAVGKPIVKVEVPITGNKYCFYYTLYRADYDHTPYGDEPGGTPVVVVYDDTDFAKDKVSNEKTGSKYGTDAAIGMDNYVVRDVGGEIWQVVLILGNDKYIRMHSVQNAVTGPDLVKIGAKLAEKIKANK